MQLEELACPNCGAVLPVEIISGQQIECASCGSRFIITPPGDESPMVCPKCQTINAPEIRFCTGCGESLKVDCILCHALNRVGMVHCVNCGAHLEHARAKRERMQQKKRKLQQERMQRLKEKKDRQQEEKLQMLLDALDEPENHDFAIYQINQIGAKAIEALADTLLNDQDPDARYGSARALGQICSQHDIKGLIKAKAAKALTQALTDSESAVRYWSVDALGRCGSQASVEPLAALLKDPHEGVRNHTRHALELIGSERANEILAQNKSKGILRWIKRN